ncbi:protein of unknown function DUF323 [hydrothermal vent metagenome]|uniref:Sulfatase-modifying factor enzyme-like domain-containing protein n=1 Tax=hydrothermal vent metagenome TaxID=652676 RepID=A0A1W1CQN6_9ZZZZ
MLKLLLCIPFLFSFSGCSDGQASADKNKISTMSVKELLKKTDSNMIKVKGGTFMMGDVGGIINGKDEKRATWTTDDDVVHKVTLSDFSMSKYEVTLSEYDVYSEDAGVKRIYDYVSKKTRKKMLKKYARVENWQRAKDYCQWLGKVSGKEYDLPTEAQWEYAARNGGKRVVFATDDGTYRKGENCDIKGLPGKFLPSPLDFYDLSSGAREWVNDWYTTEYEVKAVTNPSGPKSGSKKVSRGNAVSFVDNANYSRTGLDLDTSSSGFRCVENY